MMRPIGRNVYSVSSGGMRWVVRWNDTAKLATYAEVDPISCLPEFVPLIDRSISTTTATTEMPRIRTTTPTILPRTMATLDVHHHRVSAVHRPYPLNTTSQLQQQQRHFTTTQQQKQQQQQQNNKRDFDYCVDLVQQRDRESYLCGLLMPYQARRAYFAIRAWNVEVASIKDGSVSRKAGGAQFAAGDDSGANLALKVRMQWWREALQQIYNKNNDDEGGSGGGNNSLHSKRAASSTRSSIDDALTESMASSYSKNPIVRVLEHNVHDKQLTRRFLERLLEARETDLDTRQPETVQDMVDYADRIFSSLLYLSLETVDVRDEEADRMAQHAGIGIGLVTALRGARFRLARGEFPVPQELLAGNFPYHKLYNLSDELDVDLDDQERRVLQEAVEHISGLAYSHLQQAQALQSTLPKVARPCFLPVVPVLHYLTKLEKADYNIFDDSLLEQDHLTILFLLSRTWLTGVF